MTVQRARERLYSLVFYGVCVPENARRQGGNGDVGNGEAEAAVFRKRETGMSISTASTASTVPQYWQHYCQY